jgi:regulator of nucleoside diphosphate kinase
MKKQSSKKIYITVNDMNRLEELLGVASTVNVRDNKHLEELAKELEKADVVESTEIPANVITMNSMVLLKDLETAEDRTFTLVFPRQANIDQNKVSILAPVGTAMIGCRIGHVIVWNAPAGERRMRVEKILYQPEAAGDYHL